MRCIDEIILFMKTKSIITIYPQTAEQVNAIKAFMKALKIKFDISKVEDKPYDPEFVEKIFQGKKEIEQGKGITLSMGELNELCK